MLDLRRPRAAVSLVFVVTLIAWAPAVLNDFVWDDFHNLVYSDRLKSWSAMWESFLHDAMWSANLPEAPVGTYRPLALASFALDHQLFGQEPWGYHLSSIVWHALAACAFYGALLALERTRGIDRPYERLSIVLLWALWPTQVEVVAWINGRSDVFVVLFGALALIGGSRGRNAWVRGLAFGAGAFGALLGKEVGLAFIAVGPLLCGIARSPERRLPIDLPTAFGGIGALGIWLAIRNAVLSGGAISASTASLDAVWVAPAVVFQAFRAWWLPMDLSLGHLFLWYESLQTADYVAYTVAFAFALGGLAVAWRNARRSEVGWVVFWLVSIAPIPLLVVSDWPGFNRWLYVGGLGLSAAAIGAGRDLLTPATARRVYGVVLGLALFQMQRGIQVWKDDLSVFTRMSEELPEEPFSYLAAATVFNRAGLRERAAELAAATKHLKLRKTLPGYLVAELHLARIECDDAVRVLLAAAPRESWPSRLLFNTGVCFLRAGNVDRARPLLSACANTRAECRTYLDRLP